MTATDEDGAFRAAVQGLLAGDFSRLAPLFDGPRPLIVSWQEAGRFAGEPAALAEAFTCASFLGKSWVVEFLLAHGLDPSGGDATGLDAVHWAANRGQLETLKLLLRHDASVETRSRHGATALGTAVWSAIHEPRPAHIPIIKELIRAGAQLDAVGYPTGNGVVDAVLKRYIEG